MQRTSEEVTETAILFGDKRKILVRDSSLGR